MRSNSRKPAVHAHESIAVVTLSLLAMLTFGVTDMFSAPDSPTIAHANTSANPYQPVRWQHEGTTPSYNGGIRSYDGTPASRTPVSPAERRSLERRLKGFRNAAALVAAQIVRTEDMIDLLRKKAAPSSTIDALTARLASLDKRLAGINAQIASLEIRIDPSLDQSQ